MEDINLYVHNKQEYPPMHTAEHILNQTMNRMFGCDRSKSSHIEKKKSKCDYFLREAPTEEQIAEIERRVNDVIKQNLPVKNAFLTREEIPVSVDLSKLPENVSNTLRLVYVGDYDVCACIGDHVSNTTEIGSFRVISTEYTEGKFRIRFKLD